MGRLGCARLDSDSTSREGEQFLLSYTTVLFRKGVGRCELRVESTISAFKIRKKNKQFVKGHRLEKVESLIRLP